MSDDEQLLPGLGDAEATAAAPRFTARQMRQYFATEKLVGEFGKFDQGLGPDGAHYVSESPFADEGLVCANCLYYEGPRGCEVVDGDIAPEAICKLWVIPQDLVVEPVTPEEPPAPATKVATPEPTGPDRNAALRLARRLGCEDAHQLPDGTWAPCPTPAALAATVKDGAAGYAAWRKAEGLSAPSSERSLEAVPEGLRRAKVRAEVARFHRTVARRAEVMQRNGGN
jgi:hypothetical protein